MFSRTLYLEMSRQGPLCGQDVVLAQEESTGPNSPDVLCSLELPNIPVANMLRYWSGGLALSELASLVQVFDKAGITQNGHIKPAAALMDAHDYVVSGEARDILARHLLPKTSDNSDILEIPLNLGDALRDISLHRANGILAATTTARLERLRVPIAPSVEPRFMDIDQAIRYAAQGIERAERRRRQFQREFAEYGLPTPGMNKPNRSSSAKMYTREALRALALPESSSMHAAVVFADELRAILRATRLSIRKTATKNTITFSSGEAMIETCFAFAQGNKIPLSLQVLARPGDADLYQELTKRFPGVMYATPTRSYIDDPAYDVSLLKFTIS